MPRPAKRGSFWRGGRHPDHLSLLRKSDWAVDALLVILRSPTRQSRYGDGASPSATHVIPSEARNLLSSPWSTRHPNRDRLLAVDMFNSDLPAAPPPRK